MKPRSAGYLVENSSLIEEGVRIGPGTRISHFSHICEGATIGENCLIGDYVYIGNGVRIGNEVNIQSRVSIYPGVAVEDRVFCGPGVIFTNVIHPRAFIEERDEFRSTLLRRGSTVGAGATVLCGVTLGRYSFSGAGSVVTRDVPDFGLVYGNPAKIEGWVCRCGHTLKTFDRKREFIHVCPSCQSRFQVTSDGFHPISQS
ncbi:MAG: acyltransferase [Planctomycetota bacterium]|jgi:UDP-2-acetamido-3-amino-2,3-dideoxy-glucuronate N-acetyltransferase|nr:acyltransferase [Planctomycetota bacterium]